MGFVFGGVALYHYLRWESGVDLPRLPVALAAFAIQYGFVFILAALKNYRLLPSILMFLTAVALIIVIRLGQQAHSKAGRYIGLAGLLTLCAYICKFGYEYHLCAEFGCW